jgi:hypothetical protein
MTRCGHCPVVGPCVAEKPGHGFACAMAARGSEAELLWIASQSDGYTPPPLPPQPEPTPAVDFAALRNATKLGSKNCWFSEHDAGCGCNGLQCHLLGRRINIYDCVKCLARW